MSERRFIALPLVLISTCFIFRARLRGIMLALLVALTSFAFLDSLDVLILGVTVAVVYSSRLERRSPLPGGLSFIAGVFMATVTFGVCAIIGQHLLTGRVDFELTPRVRYWIELILGLTLSILAIAARGGRSETPVWVNKIHRRPLTLGFAGIATGLGKPLTSVPYLAMLAMLAAQEPLPLLWPLMVVAYWVIAFLLSLLIIGLSVRRTTRTQHFLRKLVRVLTRYGQISVRVLFACIGIALCIDVLLHHGDLHSVADR